VDEERDGSDEEVRRRLEVGVEHGDELAGAHVGVAHPLLEVAGLVPGPVLARLVLDVDPLLRGPPLALALHQLLPSPSERHQAQNKTKQNKRQVKTRELTSHYSSCRVAPCELFLSALCYSSCRAVCSCRHPVLVVHVPVATGGRHSK
jgi:hypothetical protein